MKAVVVIMTAQQLKDVIEAAKITECNPEEFISISARLFADQIKSGNISLAEDEEKEFERERAITEISYANNKISALTQFIQDKGLGREMQELFHNNKRTIITFGLMILLAILFHSLNVNDKQIIIDSSIPKDAETTPFPSSEGVRSVDEKHLEYVSQKQEKETSGKSQSN